MKKSGVCVLLVILLTSLLFITPLVLQSILVSSQDDDVPGLTGDKALPVVSEIEKGKEAYEKYINETTWQYLGREWKRILLQNKAVASIDAFLTKFSIVFTILFGEPYSLSLVLLVVIILWFYSLFTLLKIFRIYALFSSLVAFAIPFTLVIIMAHFKVFRKITEGILWLIFEKKEWYWHLIFSVLIIAALFLIYHFLSKVAKAAKEAGEKREEEERQVKLAAGAEIAEGMIEGVTAEKENWWKWLIAIGIIIIIIIILSLLK